jgi:hydrogenase expression/formation protein HypC
MSSVPGCYDGVCITCSDQAVEVTIVELLEDRFAVVDTGAGRETVSVALVSAGVGDRILVHASEAIATLDDAGSASLTPRPDPERSIGGD